MSLSRPVPGPARQVAARVREMAGLGTSVDARQHATPLAAALGGWRGMFDSGFPAVVFVSANAIDGLRTGVIAALGAGLVILLLRLARHQPVAQAAYGFVAVAVCAFVAARLGKAEGYFLPGILINAFYAGVGVLSVLVKRPLAGYALAALDRRFENWRVRPALRRCGGEITLIWSAVFLLRFAVQTMLYASERVGWLAVTKIVLGWPVTGAAILITLALIRRVLQGEGDAAGTAAVGSPQASAAAGGNEGGRVGADQAPRAGAEQARHTGLGQAPRPAVDQAPRAGAEQARHTGLGQAPRPAVDQARRPGVDGAPRPAVDGAAPANHPPGVAIPNAASLEPEVS